MSVDTGPDRARWRALVRDADVARLATTRADGFVDLVPITFAMVDDDTLVTAVDHKPKRRRRLQRLDNIAANPEVGVLVDHYDPEDWDRLWWVRLRGRARVVEGGGELDAAVEALVERYEQYRQTRPEGPAIVVDVTEWTGWEAES